jgi:hypothetical protein
LIALRSGACGWRKCAAGEPIPRRTRGHFAWKANRKNARLLEAHLNSRSGKWEVR